MEEVYNRWEGHIIKVEEAGSVERILMGKFTTQDQSENKQKDGWTFSTGMPLNTRIETGTEKNKVRSEEGQDPKGAAVKYMDR